MPRLASGGETEAQVISRALEVAGQSFVIEPKGEYVELDVFTQGIVFEFEENGDLIFVRNVGVEDE